MILQHDVNFSMAACSDMKELSPAKVKVNNVGDVFCEALV